MALQSRAARITLPTRQQFGFPLLAALTLLAVAWANAAAAETSLRWRLAPGAQVNVQLAQTMRTETRIKEAVTAIQIESGLDLQWTVDRVDGDGTMQLTQAFTRLWLKTVSPDGKSSVYDSSSSEEPAVDAKPMAEAVRTLLRIRIGSSLSHRGEILEVQRSAEMDSLLSDLPALAGWKTLLTKDGMSRTLHQALGILPDTTVNVGDQWTGTRQLVTPLGKIVALDTYTYEGSTRDGDRVLERIRVATEMKPAVDAASPAVVEKLPRQQLEGIYLFDAAAGFLAESRQTQTLLTEVPYASGKIQVRTISTLAAKLIMATR